MPTAKAKAYKGNGEGRQFTVWVTGLEGIETQEGKGNNEQKKKKAKTKNKTKTYLHIHADNVLASLLDVEGGVLKKIKS